MMVFGGQSTTDSLYKQDIWEWSGTGSTLDEQDHGRDEARRALRRPAMTYDSKRDRLWLFGGYGGTGDYDDLWSWHPDTRSGR